MASLTSERQLARRAAPAWIEDLAAKQWLLPAILVCGLLLRVAVIAFAPLPAHEGLLYDDNRYDFLAWNVAQGKGFTNEAGAEDSLSYPLLPLLAAAVYAVFGHDRVLIFFLQATLSVATILLVYGL